MGEFFSEFVTWLIEWAFHCAVEEIASESVAKRAPKYCHCDTRRDGVKAAALNDA